MDRTFRHTTQKTAKHSDKRMRYGLYFMIFSCSGLMFFRKSECRTCDLADSALIKEGNVPPQEQCAPLDADSVFQSYTCSIYEIHEFPKMK